MNKILSFVVAIMLTGCASPVAIQVPAPQQAPILTAAPATSQPAKPGSATVGVTIQEPAPVIVHNTATFEVDFQVEGSSVDVWGGMATFSHPAKNVIFTVRKASETSILGVERYDCIQACTLSQPGQTRFNMTGSTGWMLPNTHYIYRVEGEDQQTGQKISNEVAITTAGPKEVFLNIMQSYERVPSSVQGLYLYRRAEDQADQYRLYFEGTDPKYLEIPIGVGASIEMVQGRDYSTGSFVNRDFTVQDKVLKFNLMPYQDTLIKVNKTVMYDLVVTSH